MLKSSLHERSRSNRGRARGGESYSAAFEPLAAARRSPHDAVNVGPTERVLSAVAGAGLAAYGLYRGGGKGTALALGGAVMLYRGASGHCACYAALDAGPVAKTVMREQGWRRARINSRSVTINAPRKEIYDLLRNPERITDVLGDIVSVSALDDRRSRWTVSMPARTPNEWHEIEWIERITQEISDRLISWRTEEHSDVRGVGSIRLEDAPGGRGTEVHVTLAYEPPGGDFGRVLAFLAGREPSLELRKILNRLKQRLETGEFAMAEGSTNHARSDR